MFKLKKATSQVPKPQPQKRKKEKNLQLKAVNKLIDQFSMLNHIDSLLR